MTPDQISKWAADGESETLELKRSVGERKEAAKSVCAMLNHRGGRVLIGVEPGGRVIGQEIGEHTLDRLTEEWQRIEPPAFPTLGRAAGRPPRAGDSRGRRRRCRPVFP